MGRGHDSRLFGRRLIALAAAYAIALSGLFASFAAASAVAEAAAVPGAVICHTVIDGQQAPSSGGSSGKLCLDCCTGCAMHLAALPPPPATAAPLAQVSGKRVALPPIAGLTTRPATGSHRSRAPPLQA